MSHCLSLVAEGPDSVVGVRFAGGLRRCRRDSRAACSSSNVRVGCGPGDLSPGLDWPGSPDVLFVLSSGLVEWAGRLGDSVLMLTCLLVNLC